ncbi:MAG: tRNA preQ1(34) S-adenosylmethionine ribosyltransferase-isomerase QueA [Deltaproteobacteria bacterium]|nr:tRNA preQ1(34) S-adenosylmethionine ribosyltransferase-isomerase QueA [Deltaproteobacteria bacterium]
MPTKIYHEAYNYQLSPDRIAQRPVHPYDTAKLLTVNRREAKIEDSNFTCLPRLLRAGDLLVFNDSRVIPARFLGKMAGRDASLEVLLVHRQSGGIWRCLGKPLKKFKPGSLLVFEEGLRAKVLERVSEQEVLLEFFCEDEAVDLNSLMSRVGQMPIPPYIRRGRADESDRLDYQTIFASRDGSIAAPTASLHFTPELITGLKEARCQIAYATLHVGTASFLPLWDEVGEGVTRLKAPAAETYGFCSELLSKMVETKARGGRVIAVGTTMVRALESMVRHRACSGAFVETDLFILPGFEFKVVDALITNFHQPRTTHLLLVQAFMGRLLLERSYQHALSNEYRFLSYGDGMFIE